MRYIHQGETIPPGYGIAWLDPVANRLACYPVPINIIVRAARRVWYWIAGHRSGLVDERASAAAANEAWRAGYECGMEDGKRGVKAALVFSVIGSKGGTA